MLFESPGGMDARAAGRQSRRRNYLPFNVRLRTNVDRPAGGRHAGRSRPQTTVTPHLTRRASAGRAHHVRRRGPNTVHALPPRARGARGARPPSLSLNLSTAERAVRRAGLQESASVSEAPAARVSSGRGRVPGAPPGAARGTGRSFKLRRRREVIAFRAPARRRVVSKPGTRGPPHASGRSSHQCGNSDVYPKTPCQHRTTWQNASQTI